MTDNQQINKSEIAKIWDVDKFRPIAQGLSDWLRECRAKGMTEDQIEKTMMQAMCLTFSRASI